MITIINIILIIKIAICSSTSYESLNDSNSDYQDALETVSNQSDYNISNHYIDEELKKDSKTEDIELTNIGDKESKIATQDINNENLQSIDDSKEDQKLLSEDITKEGQNLPSEEDKILLSKDISNVDEDEPRSSLNISRSFKEDITNQNLYNSIDVESTEFSESDNNLSESTTLLNPIKVSESNFDKIKIRLQEIGRRFLDFIFQYF